MINLFNSHIFPLSFCILITHLENRSYTIQFLWNPIHERNEIADFLAKATCSRHFLNEIRYTDFFP